ncbi:MAG: YetF domain-containing protein [Bacillota bacterium]
MLALRALVVYPLLILLFRFLGRGLQFQSRPYDIAVQVLIGSAAANLIVVQDVPLWRAFPALGTLALLHTLLSFGSLWNPLKKFLVGEPAPVIENGRILKANLIKYQLSVEELLSALRQQGYHNLADVEFALLESSGKLSVVPRSQARPVTPRDLKLSTNYEGYSTMLIADGKVDQQNLQKIGLTPEWLLGELVKRGAEGAEDVLFASIDTQGQLFVVRNYDVPFLQSIFMGVQTQTKPGLPPMVGPDMPNPQPPEH